MIVDLLKQDLQLDYQEDCQRLKLEPFAVLFSYNISVKRFVLISLLRQRCRKEVTLSFSDNFGLTSGLL